MPTPLTLEKLTSRIPQIVAAAVRAVQPLDAVKADVHLTQIADQN
jgi:hypothetical protein